MASPTVILMLKAPIPGTVKTRLAATVGEAEAVRIYRLLAEQQLAVLPADWAVTVHCAPSSSEALMRDWLHPLRAGLVFTPQTDGDLGQRLSTAFATEFARGASTVIAIGGDCPGLDQRILGAAAAALLTHDAVVGPATDGGYYLLGLQRPCPALFQEIAWSTAGVLAQTRDKLRAAGLTWTELPPLEDVDDQGSWDRAVAGRLIINQRPLQQDPRVCREQS
jgi:uncharacterized protein